MNCDESPKNGWTVNTLHAHLIGLINAKEERDSERFRSQKETTALALSAADRAVTKAEQASDKRFDGVNEFRATLADQQRLLMPRNEAVLVMDALDQRIKALEDGRLNREGQSKGLHLGWMILVGALGFVGTVGTLVSLMRSLGKS